MVDRLGATPPPPLMLPDLRPGTSWFVGIGPEATAMDPTGTVVGPGSGPSGLRFTTMAQNTGSYALDLTGTPTADPERWVAQQCTSWFEQICQARRDSGSMVWHPAHNHFHFEEFARYELRNLTAEDTPDMTAAGLRSSGPKVSFCLQDSARVEGSFTDRPPRYVGCPGAVQGISAGWMDIYDMGLPGQWLSLEGVSDGRYALVITLDPWDRLLETDEANNAAYAVVEIFDDATQARVVGGDSLNSQ